MKIFIEQIANRGNWLLAIIPWFNLEVCHNHFIITIGWLFWSINFQFRLK